MRIRSTRLIPMIVAVMAIVAVACDSDQSDDAAQIDTLQQPATPGVMTMTPGYTLADPMLNAALIDPAVEGHPDFEIGEENEIVIGPIDIPDTAILAAPGGFGVPDLPASNCTPNYLLDTTGSTPVDDRTKWWTANPPPTGPITQPFVCEFSVALTTVVGPPRVDDIYEQLPANSPYQRVDWPATGLSPNPPPTDVDDRGIPIPRPSEQRVDFVIRNMLPNSRPRVRNLTNLNNDTHKVVVNESQNGALPDLTGTDQYEFRPSLWIDFATPQRAVGVEYGINADDAFDGSGIRLIGYDVNGNLITDYNTDLSAASDGKARPVNADSSYNPPGPEVGIGVNNLTDRIYSHPIGIRDKLGRIATVELRFDWFNADEVRLETAPPEKVKGPQAVTRIWYEPLPPVAIKQGVAGIEVPAQPGNGFENLYDVGTGAVSEPLPFGFDRALVFMRGARFMLLDSEPHEISELSAFVAQNALEFARTGNRNVVITPNGSLLSSPSQPFRIVTYYTLLAWDSRQVTLFEEPGSTGIPTFAQRRQEILLRNNDTLQVSAISVPNPCRARRCETFFGGLTSLQYRFDSPAEIKKLYLLVGAQRYLSGAVDSPMLQRVRGGGVLWGFNTDFEGKDDEIHSFDANGRVIAGPSLILGPADQSLLDPTERALTAESRTSAGFTFCPTSSCEGEDGLTGPNEAARRIPHDQLNGTPNQGWMWPVLADAAFLGYSVGHVYPDRKIRELDWEFKLTGYDGHIADWRMGFGVDTKSASDNPDDRPMFGIPAFGGVVRHDIAREVSVDTNSIDVSNGIVGLTSYGDGNGMIRNVGNVGPLVITNINRPNVSDNDLFEFVFMVPRHPADGQTPISRVRLEENEFRARLPYTLRPGQTILVNARYTPDEEAFFGDPPSSPRHTGRLEIDTSNLRYRSLTLFVAGSAQPSNPAGEWRPDSLSFIEGTLQQEKFAFLVATGATPLVINQVSIADTSTGFTFERIRSIEPDAAVFKISCSGGVNPCSGATQLNADTNAGVLSLELLTVTP